MERSSSRQSSRAIGRVSQNRGHITPPSQIKVVARFRPNIEDSASCIDEINHQSVQISGLSQQFNFDRVFGPNSDQKSVFDEAVKPTVEGVLAGYNGCVLAYGQTGAGKSHTMMGGSSEEDRGAIPRMVEYLFAEKPESYSVKVGYLEIYNEKVRDLLGASYPGDDLRVHEVNGGGGFYVKGLTEIQVDSAGDVYALMRKGDKNRSTAATNMNSHSSRSHSVFLVDVYGPQTRSKLVLVDLAGSEKVAKTGARGTLLEEAVNINRSLSSLGMVVNALASVADQASNQASNQSSNQNSNPSSQSASDGSHTQAHMPFQHIPFRDSKLTRILQDSLGGNSRTCLIVHCSPSNLHISETVSTLRFGVRAKHVKTVPRINYNANGNGSANGSMNTSALNATIGYLQTEQLKLQHDLLETHRDMNKMLKKEQSRLIAQKTLDMHAYTQKKEQINSLEMQIKEEDNRARTDETYLLSEIHRLEPRISSHQLK